MVKNPERGAATRTSDGSTRDHSKNLSLPKSLDHDVQQAVLYPDDLDDLFAIQPSRERRLRLSGGQSLFLGGSTSKLDLGTHLPRDLHRDRCNFFHGESWVEARPTR